MRKVINIGLIAVFILSLFLNFRFLRNHYITQKTAAAGDALTLQVAIKTKQAKARLLENMAVDSNDVVFVGSSLTEGFPVTELFGDLHVKNRGISGGTMEDIKNLMPFLLKGKPKKLFIEIGINDLKNKIEDLPMAKNRLLADYLSLLNTTRHSGASLYIESLLPVNEIYFHGNTVAINQAIIQINDSLKTLASRYDCTYVDLHKELGKDELHPEYTVDGLHLNEAGYKIWFDKIKEDVE